MGAWGTDIMDNDTSLDVYHDYRTQIAEGKTPEAAKKALSHHFYYEGEPMMDDTSNEWFALAYAQLELNHLDEEVVRVVGEIIDEDIDIENWIDLEAEEEDIEERREIIQRFYEEVKGTFETGQRPGVYEVVSMQSDE